MGVGRLTKEPRAEALNRQLAVFSIIRRPYADFLTRPSACLPVLPILPILPILPVLPSYLFMPTCLCLPVCAYLSVPACRAYLSMCRFRLDLAYYPIGLLHTYPCFPLNFQHLPHVYIVSFLYRLINTQVFLTYGLAINTMPTCLYL